MNIGDKVRLIHSKEQGIVYRFLQGDVVEVEIEDGFRLPVLKRELVVVAAAEATIFKPQKAAEIQPAVPKTTGVRAERGIFMAFVQLNDREVSLHLLNNTDWDLPYTLTSSTERLHRGLAGGFLKGKTSIKVQELAIKDFEEWGTFAFQCFHYTVGHAPERAPLIKRIKFRPDTFFKSKKVAPLLEKDAFLFQLDNEEPKAEPLTAQALREKMLTPNAPEPTLTTKIEKPAAVIDLHIEELTTNHAGMGNAQMIEIQLNTFDSQLEKAIASGMDYITFIHGVGSGALRNELHRRLSKHKNVQFFEDAQKEKFGYGATKVKIK
ncbi:MAG: DUF2027 domain-containing protein [Runella slithyformis]|nr:MAG: DUF2027 domain-containing protein [Runella slithyformis]TAF02853.1 MAG: DUF2027 domain-containing protein [Runella slithyformis]TAF27705.1 MAG: DUF2027 domain-containing protein [Runella slithyformis]TAF44617.1 MAG: DUF2027 domain-containing protein [Runella slithyformis]TAF80904.1 MAG: DUF2027 domain-containing protein [Runella slithyformis]